MLASIGSWANVVAGATICRILHLVIMSNPSTVQLWYLPMRGSSRSRYCTNHHLQERGWQVSINDNELKLLTVRLSR